MNLTEFAGAAQSARKQCSVCLLRKTHPKLYEEIVQGEQRCVSRRVMMLYLREQHSLSISDQMIGHHFRQEHHKERPCKAR
jgi:hypothetical protein